MSIDRLNPPKHHHARVILEQMAVTLRKVADGLAGKRVLDFGAGDSPYRSLLADGFDEVVTLDLPGRGADLDLGADGVVPADDGTFDCVLSTQVLEHVEDVEAHLSEARRLLSEGGTLVLSTHGLYRYHPDPVDYRRWTRPGLEKVLSDAGFAVSAVHPVVAGPAAPLSIAWHQLEVGVPRRLRPAWHFVGQSIVSFVLRITSRVEWDDAAVYVTISSPRAMMS